MRLYIFKLLKLRPSSTILLSALGVATYKLSHRIILDVKKKCLNVSCLIAKISTGINSETTYTYSRQGKKNKKTKAQSNKHWVWTEQLILVMSTIYDNREKKQKNATGHLK